MRDRMTAVARARTVTAGAIVALSLVVGALVLAGARTPNVDDAFIVLVYARHWLEHGALYWNASEGAVDGFTSVADLALKTLAIAAFKGDAVRTTHALSIAEHLASVAAGAVFALRAARPTFRSYLVAAIASLAFATNLALADATSYWLETPLYALLALVALGTLLFGAPASPWLRALLALEWMALSLTRPEGIPIAMFFGAWFALVRGRHLSVRERGGPLVFLALALGAYLSWHWSKFGALAPNAYYAKTSDSRWLEIKDGAAYVLAWGRSGTARAVWMMAVFLAPLGAIAARWWGSQFHRAAFLAASVAALMAIVEVVVEGGDSYDSGRFIAVPLVLSLASLALAAQGLAGARKWIPIGALLVLVVGEGRHACSHLAVRVARIAAWPDDGRDYGCELDLTRTLARSVASVAETDFQRMKWFADDLDVIDLAGLNDRKRAHESQPGRDRWGKGELGDAPATDAEALVLGPRWLYARSIATTTTRAIVEDPRLALEFLGARFPPSAREALVARYVPAALPNPCGGYMNFFVRVDRAAALEASGAELGRAE